MRIDFGLRATITTFVVVIGALAVVSGLMLAGLTTLLRLSAEEMVASMRSLRLVEAAEVDLLLHARARDAALRAAHEGELWRRLTEASDYVTSAEERAVLARTVREVKHYVEVSRVDASTNEAGEALATALGSLEALLDVNTRQSRVAAARTARADRLGTVLGLGSLLLIAGLVGVLLWWLWRRALAPILDLGAAMRKFGAGDRGARAEVRGAAELCIMAQHFNDMASELTRQREAQMTFLAGVAHDLRNPLGPLKTAATLLAKEGTSQSGRGTNVATMLRVVSNQVDHLDHLVGDLLEIGRIEAGRLDLRLQEVDARCLAEEAVELFRPGAPNIAFELSTPKAPIPLRCDPLRIQQVLNNLISNAIKYSSDDGRVAISVRRETEHVSFCVSDRGMGIAEHDLERLFEPFRRAHRAAESPVPGEGLGLFVARRIVEAHAGNLDVVSVEGEGSTFRVQLPVASPSRAIEAVAG